MFSVDIIFWLFSQFSQCDVQSLLVSFTPRPIAYGPKRSKEMHLHYKPSEIPYYPEGKSDDTHLSVKGATEVSKLVVTEFKKTNLKLSSYFR